MLRYGMQTHSNILNELPILLCIMLYEHELHNINVISFVGTTFKFSISKRKRMYFCTQLFLAYFLKVNIPKPMSSI